MSFKPINQQVDINAPALKVWDVLTDDTLIRKWYEPFHPGAYAIADWTEGSKAIFTDASGTGMVAKIIQSKPGVLLDMEMIGMYRDNKEEYESKEAKEIAGGHETYKLREVDGVTTLFIETAMYEQYYEQMNRAWEKALQVIKQLSEENN